MYLAEGEKPSLSLTTLRNSDNNSTFRNIYNILKPMAARVCAYA